MQNHQLAPAKYHFCDSLNERLMFLHNFCFRFKTSSVHFICRESDISHEPIDDLTSKMNNYALESKEKDHF